MPKAILGLHKKKADIYFLAAVVFIVWMMLLQGFLELNFPAGLVDSVAPTQAPQRASSPENAPDAI